MCRQELDWEAHHTKCNYFNKVGFSALFPYPLRRASVILKSVLYFPFIPGPLYFQSILFHRVYPEVGTAVVAGYKHLVACNNPYSVCTHRNSDTFGEDGWARQ